MPVKEEVDLLHERRIIAYSILSTEFLAGILPNVNTKYFATPFARRVWDWVAEYFTTYHTAPESDIQAIYISKAMEREEDVNSIIATFLANLSRDFPAVPANLDFVIDESNSYLRLRKLIYTQEQLQKAVEKKDVTKGEQLIAEFSAAGTRISKSISVFEDVGAAVGAFAHKDDVLFRFPGALGQVVGDVCRTDFVGIQGPFKSGKSWWAQHYGLTAAMNDLQVLFVPLEMPEWQVERRMWMQIMAQPRYERPISIPFFYEDDHSSDTQRLYQIGMRQPKTMPAIDPRPELFEKWMQEYKFYYGKGGIRIRRMRKGSTIKDLEALLISLDYYEKFTPDVIIIDQLDYFDSHKRGDDWLKKDDIWSSARDLAMERNCLIVSPTQTNAEGLKSGAGLNTAAGFKGKIGHVTKCVDIYRSPHDVERGIYRISCSADRDDENLHNVAITLSCLSIGQVALDSRLKSEVVLEKEKE